MPSELIRFPGDLITADLWNRMLELIDRVNARIDENEALIMPDVVGDLLPTARDEIARAQLGFSTILDVDGARADPGDDAVAGRIVLAQMPSPDVKVPIGSRVSLLITAAKVVQPNAPVINEVKPAAGANAQVGRPLDLVGVNFVGNVRVIIRGRQLGASEFTVQSATQIHIAAVPPFEGAPAAGTTKDIPITVGNEAGDGTAVATFFEPSLPANPISIRRVHLLDAGSINVLGQDLDQRDQDTTVTMGGQARLFRAESDKSLSVSLPPEITAAYQKLPPAVFEELMRLDDRDLFVVDIVSNLANPIELFPQPAVALRSSVSRSDLVAGSELRIGRTFVTRMKLLLTMSASLVKRAGTGVAKVSGNTVAIVDALGAVIFSVDVTKLQDYTIVVKVGDKSTSFVVKFGAIPDAVKGDRGGIFVGDKIDGTIFA